MILPHGQCGHFALSTLLETWLKEAVFETNVKKNDITKNTKIQECQFWHQKQRSDNIQILSGTV